MYHIKITDKDTGNVKLEKDVEFCAGAYKTYEDFNEDMKFVRYGTFTYSDDNDKDEVKSIIDGLLQEALFLTNNYL